MRTYLSGRYLGVYLGFIDLLEFIDEYFMKIRQKTGWIYSGPVESVVWENDPVKCHKSLLIGPFG